MNRAVVGAARVAAVTAIAFGALLLLRRPITLNQDTLRDLLLARECFDGIACVSHGPRAGLGDYLQGAVWIWFLVGMRALHLPVALYDVVVAAFLALATGLTVELGARLRLASPLPIALGLAVLAAFAALMPFGVLHNPSLLPLPVVACCVAAVAFAARGGAVWAGAAGVSLALSLDTHGVAVTLLPGLVVLVAAARERLFDPALAFAFALPASMWLVSRDAFESNLDTAIRTGLLAPAVVGLVALAAASALLLRPRLARLAPRRRALVALALLSASSLCGTLGLTGFYGEELLPYYFMPAVPGLALLLLLALDRALARLPQTPARASRVALTLAAALALLPLHRPTPAAEATSWTLTELEGLAGLLDERGYAYQDAFVHVFTPSRRELVAAMAAFEPTPRGGPARDDLPDLVVVPAGPDAEEAGADGVSRSALPGGRDALWAAVDPWLDRRRGRVCYTPLDSPPGDSGCVPVRVEPPAATTAEPVLFQSRSLPYLGDIELAAVDGALQQTHPGGTRVRWQFEVDAAAPGARVLVVDTRPPDRPGCEWRFTGVEGFAPAESLPARRLTLSAAAPTRGSVTIDRTLGASGCRPEVPQFTPDVFELPADSALLRAPFFREGVEEPAP